MEVELQGWGVEFFIFLFLLFLRPAHHGGHTHSHIMIIDNISLSGQVLEMELQTI